MTRVTNIMPDIISYGYAYATIAGMPAVPGGTAGAGFHVDLLRISNGYLMKWDPYTGIMTANISISPLSSGTYYMHECALTVQNLGSEYRLINWTTAGTAETVTDRVISNTTYARNSLPSLIDYNVGIGATVSSISHPTIQGPYQIGINAYDLYTGAEIWNTTIDDETPYTGGTAVADHGKVAVLTKNGYWLAYDLKTGNQAWKSETMDYPWDECSFGAYEVQSAYGLFYRQGYGGVYAFDWDDGSIAWKYRAPAVQFESPYIDENGEGVYSFMAGAIIVDGKLFTHNTEHTPSLPLTRGWGLHCMDAITGEPIWNITGPMSTGAVADGYLTASNQYDGYIYVFGKGKSATTVTAPDVVVPLGTGVVIKGTVLDMSPAQPNTPCVSKESMTTQMEYLHMQHPVNGLYGDATITGVTVYLTAIDQDNNVYDLGTVTSNGYYGTFGYEWTPPEEGFYEIIASFMGDDSYGSSVASTFVSVGPAPSPAGPIEPEPTEAPFITTEIAIILAVAVIAVIGIVAYWSLKRRK
jgi:outer membrane protein assembly factor BamB